MPKKEITIRDLARMIGDVSKSVDELATITKNGFEVIENEMDVRFGKVEQNINEVKMRQDNAAYRFETRDLEKRVTTLENRARPA